MSYTQETLFQKPQKPEGFSHSVVSYPNRGHWGKSSWRGNCSGHIVRNALGSYFDFYNDRALFVDPSEGSGTSRDVAHELGIRYQGLDLHSGFNLLRDDLSETLGEPAQMAFWHPPYASMIQYSGNVWGNGDPHPDDLSNCSSIAEFVEKCQLALMNIYDALQDRGNGVYCVLIGNMRSRGRYYDLTDMLKRVAPGTLRDIVIKQQHNCTSDRRKYQNNIVRIAHETLLVFERDGKIHSAIDFAALIEHKTKLANAMTWRTVVKRAVMGRGVVHLKDIYEAVEAYAEAKGSNRAWQAKVRQIVRRFPEDFRARGDGFYESAAA